MILDIKHIINRKGVSMVKCELCGKEVKTAQALRGHKTFIHGITGSNTQQPVARLASEQQVSKVEDRLQQLEYITGLRESNWDDLLSDTELPLSGRVTNITEQVSKLGDAVSKLSDTVSKLKEAVELAQVTKAMVDAEREQCSKRLTDLREAHNRQAAVINDHRDTFNNNFAVLGARTDKVQNMVQDLGESLNTVRTKLTAHGHDSLKSVPELVAKVGNLEQALGTMQSRIEYLARVAKREPTGNTVQLTLSDHKEHTFREYKSTRGLTKPYQSSHDLIFGKRWVDLAEAED